MLGQSCKITTLIHTRLKVKGLFLQISWIMFS